MCPSGLWKNQENTLLEIDFVNCKSNVSSEIGRIQLLNSSQSLSDVEMDANSIDKVHRLEDSDNTNGRIQKWRTQVDLSGETIKNPKKRRIYRISHQGES